MFSVFSHLQSLVSPITMLMNLVILTVNLWNVMLSQQFHVPHLQLSKSGNSKACTIGRLSITSLAMLQCTGRHMKTAAFSLYANAKIPEILVKWKGSFRLVLSGTFRITCFLELVLVMYFIFSALFQNILYSLIMWLMISVLKIFVGSLKIFVK